MPAITLRIPVELAESRDHDVKAAYLALAVLASRGNFRASRQEIYEAGGPSKNMLSRALGNLKTARLVRSEKVGNTEMWTLIEYADFPYVGTERPKSGTEHPKVGTEEGDPITRGRSFSGDFISPEGDMLDAAVPSSTPDTEHCTENGNQAGGQADNPDEFLSWLPKSDQALGLLPPHPDFDAIALTARFAKARSPRLWSQQGGQAQRVFEIIHRHPRWNPPGDQVPVADLERLVDEATQHRPGRHRLTREPKDLLRKTSAGAARWQAILAYDEPTPPTRDAPARTDKPAPSAIDLYNQQREEKYGA